MDYCDVFISCLDSHSDGTHSLQRIHLWASDVLLNFSHIRIRMSFIGQVCLHIRGICYSDKAPQCNRMTATGQDTDNKRKQTKTVQTLESKHSSCHLRRHHELYICSNEETNSLTSWMTWGRYTYIYAQEKTVSKQPIKAVIFSDVTLLMQKKHASPCENSHCLYTNLTQLTWPDPPKSTI